jgi:RNA polymerase sigma-70 factor (ECF subfamily)
MPGSEAQTDERELVERAARGDRDSFDVLVRRHQDRIFSVAYQIVRNREDALDVAQEAFAKAYVSLSSFKGESSFTTWVHRIVVNLSIDCLRRRRRGEVATYDDRLAIPEDAEPGPAASDDPESALEARQVQALLARGLQLLPPVHRAVLVLREIEGLSYDEIARAVGCSLGTVMSRLFYARRKLQKVLQAHRHDLR